MYRRERLACRLADVVLMDTSPHCQFMTQLYRLPLEKFERLFVGQICPTTLVSARCLPKAIGKNCSATSMAATRRFKVWTSSCGRPSGWPTSRCISTSSARDGSTPRCASWQMNLASATWSFIEPVDYPLAAYHQIADIGLGVFGKTETGLRPVIPNKVQEGWPRARAVVTGHLSAMDELLTDDENVWYSVRQGITPIWRIRCWLWRMTRCVGSAWRCTAKKVYESRLTPVRTGRDLLETINHVATLTPRRALAG